MTGDVWFLTLETIARSMVQDAPSSADDVREQPFGSMPQPASERVRAAYATGDLVRSQRRSRDDARQGG